MIGQMLSHYKILEKIGQGGMGVLYRALDTHLDRSVAIKVLRPEAVGDPERKRRFVLEAKAASALNHPNIVTIYDIDVAGSPTGPVDFIAMEFVEGQSLDRIINARGLPVAQALAYAVQISTALAAAHAAGIVHRDIKPANIMVTPAGHVKVLDFGLAKLAERTVIDEAAPTVTAGRPTEEGRILGTLAYLSPEQAEGRPVDARSDVFSFGIMLYEMVAGERPFHGDSSVSALAALLRDQPAPLRRLRSDVPPELERIILRCLEKDREARYSSGAELSKDLVACHSRPSSPTPAVLLRRPASALVAAALLAAMIAGATWLWVRSSRTRGARNALPEIARLIQEERFAAALRLARQAEPYLSNDPQLQRLVRESSSLSSIETDPAGASVSVKDYLAANDPWETLGASPLPNARIPAGFLRYRVTKEGYRPLESATFARFRSVLRFRLEPADTSPSDMVRVPGGTYQLGSAPAVALEEYWLDRYEVSNRQFKEFVDRGGYQKREYWKHPFLKEGRTLPWEQAMVEFRDPTGRPGPATWQLGTYRVEQADFPVGGVSWYEAAAYAEFAGKSLPTVYHWRHAAGIGANSAVLRVSNFGGQGPARVGSHQGLGPFGTYDMAGNVKEWCWNQTGRHRYILGGGWNEPVYMFAQLEALEPFERPPNAGFRCARYGAPIPEALTGPIERPFRDYTKEKPARDEIFQAYKSFYTYDRTSELKPAVESANDGSEYWRREKITFNAAYGGERVTAHLFLPRNTAPPYQTVIWFPGQYAFSLEEIQDFESLWFGYLVRSGRALLYPVYKGTYGRRISSSLEALDTRRDLVIQWSKDLCRSVDYLQTRSDIDSERLAYFGLSRGAADGPIMTAIEGRFKASVLMAGGFTLDRRMPEVDPIHFAPRVKVPTLMVNSRQDLIFPVEASQLPMFRLLGTPAKDKRHSLYPYGHVPQLTNEVIREMLDWLDRYLGPTLRPG